ncbi:MAG: ribonuclease HII [Candidatus Algichlamydia australiensis]|nr:ribonuclease HII [Chlamydiales bacterium]
MKGEIESQFYPQGFRKIVGIDEAGRGPLAGPVVACALYAPESLLIKEINDSKKLTEKKRKELFTTLTTHPEIAYGVGIVSAEEIDKINILQATFLAFTKAVKDLSIAPELLLFDGPHFPKLGIPSQGIIKGDSKSELIGAASIIAKVTRDEIMCEADKLYPGYGFAGHKGYGTKSHRGAIENLGPCPIHRRSFEPIKSLVAV